MSNNMKIDKGQTYDRKAALKKALKENPSLGKNMSNKELIDLGVSKKDLPKNNTISSNTQPEGNNWSRHFADIPEDFSKGLEWKNEKGEELTAINAAFMNSLNGKYKATISKHASKQEVSKSAFSKLGESSWDLAKYVKDSSKKIESFTEQKKLDQFVEEYNTTLKEKKDAWYKNYIDAATSVGFTKEKVGDKNVYTPLPERDVFLYFDENTSELISKEQHAAESDEYFLSDREGDFGTNVQTGGGNGAYLYHKDNPKGAYRTVRMNEQMNNDNFKKVIHPVVNTFLVKGFENWKTAPGGKESASVDNRVRTVKLAESMMRYVSKYGVPPGDNENNNSNIQGKAKKLVEGMGGGTYKEKQQFIRDNQDQILEISGKLGLWGSREMYAKYKEEFKGPEYSVDPENDTSQKNILKATIKRKEDFDKTTRAIRTKALDQYKGDVYDLENASPESVRKNMSDEADMGMMVLDNLLDETGHIRSFADVKRKLEKDYGSHVDKGSGKRMYHSPRLAGRTKSETRYSGGFYEESVANEGYSYGKMFEAYHEVVSGYKKQFGEMTMDQVFMDYGPSTGVGYSKSSYVSQKHIDLNSQTGKASNLRTIMNMVEQKVSWENGQNTKIYIEDGKYKHDINEDRYKKTRLFGYENPAEKQKELYDDFFKDKDNSIYDVTFSRYTPLSGKSAYMVTRKGKNKNEEDRTITIYADRQMANSEGEKFSQGTFTSSTDWAFNQNGEWDLENLSDDVFQDVKIVKGSRESEYGYKVLIFKHFPNGPEQPHKFRRIKLGANLELDIRKAEKIVSKTLDAYRDQGETVGTDFQTMKPQQF